MFQLWFWQNLILRHPDLQTWTCHNKSGQRKHLLSREVKISSVPAVPFRIQNIINFIMNSDTKSNWKSTLVPISMGKLNETPWIFKGTIMYPNIGSHFSETLQLLTSLDCKRNVETPYCNWRKYLAAAIISQESIQHYLGINALVIKTIRNRWPVCQSWQYFAIVSFLVEWTKHNLEPLCMCPYLL